MKLSQKQLAAGARLLAANRGKLDGMPPLPEDCRPRTLADGYAMQGALHAELAVRGTVAGGHKIGCTTRTMQDYMGIDHPCAGEISSQRAYRSGAEVPLSSFCRIGFECEIAVRLASDVAPGDGPFSRESIGDIVAGLMAAVELVDDRFEDLGVIDAPTLIADDFCAAGCLLGPEALDWRALDLAAVEGVMAVDGAEAGRGRGADILGHPLEALIWLTAHAAAQGTTLKAGEFVLLGSVVKTVWPEHPGEVAVAIDGLGEARASFF